MSFYFFIVSIIGVVLFLGVVPWCCVYTALRFGGFEGFPVFWRVFYFGAWGGIFLCGSGVIWSWVEIFRGGDPERLSIALSLWFGVFLVFGFVAEYWVRRIREIGDRLFSDYKELLVLAVLCRGEDRDYPLVIEFERRRKRFFELKIARRFRSVFLLKVDLVGADWREYVACCFLFAACPDAKSLEEARLFFCQRFCKTEFEWHKVIIDNDYVFSCLCTSMELMGLSREYRELWRTKAGI